MVIEHIFVTEMMTLAKITDQEFCNFYKSLKRKGQGEWFLEGEHSTYRALKKNLLRFLGLSFFGLILSSLEFIITKLAESGTPVFELLGTKYYFLLDFSRSLLIMFCGFGIMLYSGWRAGETLNRLLRFRHRINLISKCNK